MNDDYIVESAKRFREKIRNILKKHQEHGVRYAIDDIEALFKQEITAIAEKTREETFKGIINLPIFANGHERKYQIGIDQVWKDIQLFYELLDKESKS